MTGKTVSFILALLMLCGCQVTPDKAVVASKADGAFEAALKAAPTAPAATAEATAPPTVYTDSFSNAAGDITIDLAMPEPAGPGPVPVLQARPMELTGEQAQGIAAALFGDGPIYEYSEQMTKAEIEQTILEDRQFIADWDGMLDYYGGDEALAQRVKEDFEGRIAALEDAYQTAPEGVEPVPCAWEFHSEDYYMSPDMAAALFQDEGHRYIKASATLDGLPWIFSVCNREGEDYRVHNASAYPDERVVSPEDVAAGPGMDEDAMKAFALETAAGMGLGDWAVTSDMIGEVTGMGGGDPADWYQVTLTRTYGDVQAAPFFDAPAADEQYASVYGAENMQFQFYSGRFYSFWYSAATRTVDTAAPDAPLLPFAEILDRAKEQMKMLTMDRLMYTGATARVSAETAELGLVCVPMKDNATDFYLVPAWIFCGTATAYDADGAPATVQWLDNEGNVTDEQPAQSPVLLAIVNAVDGTVIHA